jgi:hypothetical protein
MRAALVLVVALAGCPQSGAQAPLDLGLGDLAARDAHAAAPAHRATAVACAANPADAGVPACGGTLPVHDACLSDGDCGGGAVCVCESVRLGGPGPCGVPIVVGNECVSGNCRVDADCAAGALCVPDVSLCGGVAGYYCQTPGDQCSSNEECTAQASGQCTYQPARGRRECVYNVACPA